MQQLTDIQAIGRTRTIYRHPIDSDWLVKIENRHTYASAGKISLSLRSLLHSLIPALSENARELRIYRKLAVNLGDYIPEFKHELISTDKGPGLVCWQVIDDNGEASRTLAEYMGDAGGLNEELLSQFEIFFHTLIMKKLYFFDFNINNFLIQVTQGKPKLYFIDLKSYRRDRSILPLSYICSGLAERKMKRRIERFYRRCRP